MSNRSDAFEQSLVEFLIDFRDNNKILPHNLPAWMTSIGIIPGDEIISASRIGGAGHKTDVQVIFKKSPNLNISAKLSNADYFGNWYSHKKIIKEFGEEIFQTITKEVTKFSNEWLYTKHAKPFVGVSICFGKRPGMTGRRLTEVFTTKEIKIIVAGYENEIYNANSLYISDNVPSNIEDFLSKIKPIDEEILTELAKDFKLICRPINPMTEFSNRGKCVYSQYIPNERFDKLKTINTVELLRENGAYYEIENNNKNHNSIIKDLKDKYNVEVPVAKKKSE